MTLMPARDAAAHVPDPVPPLPGLLRRAACEFGLTALLLLAVVSGVRWLFAPDGYGGGGVAFALLGAGSACCSARSCSPRRGGGRADI